MIFQPTPSLSGRAFPLRRKLCVLALCLLPSVTACKTSTDAAKAATQMSATATALSNYYTALGTILANTDKLNILSEQLYNGPPYPQASRDSLAKIQKDVQQRAAVAALLSTFATNFAKLTGSTATTDVSASALKLETEAGKLASFTASANELTLFKTALQLLTKAIQEHKEREAARQLDDTVKAIAALFTKEAPTWNSLEEVYSNGATALAKQLIDHGATDNSVLLKPALDPFGLTALSVPATLNDSLASAAKQQVDAKHTDLDASYTKATKDMSDSLDEMSRRIHLVATDKPLGFVLPPVTIDAVDQWAKKIGSQ